MKKEMILILLALAVMLLNACAGKTVPETAEPVQIPNPMQESTAEEASEALQLPMEFGEEITVDSVYRIAGETELWSMNLTVDGVSWNYRITAATAEGDADISGVYMGENAEKEFTNSVPAITLEHDGSYCKAYCEWNGHFYSLSSESENKADCASLLLTLVNPTTEN